MKSAKKQIKKVKLNLDDLKIQSFVTSLDVKEQNQIQGASCPAPCTTTSCPSFTNGTDNCC